MTDGVVDESVWVQKPASRYVSYLMLFHKVMHSTNKSFSEQKYYQVTNNWNGKLYELFDLTASI